jgi:hypothetical protein
MIAAYAEMVKQRLHSGWSAHLMSFLFNQLRGSPLEKNEQMKSEIGGVYSSFLTRLIRRPRARDANHPILLSAPDWPVPKNNKKTISEILINDGLHHHGILLIAPPDRHYRLKCPIDQHFHDLQDYYIRDGFLRSVDAKAFPLADAEAVTDYALKGLKTNRIDYDDALLVLPTNHPTRRPYVKE